MCVDCEIPLLKIERKTISFQFFIFVPDYAGLILDACLPFDPLVMSKVTFCPSVKDLNPLDWIAEK